MRRRPAATLVASAVCGAALALTACGGAGGDEEDALAHPDFRLVTPPRFVGAEPIATPTPGTERLMDAADARRLRPVLDAWARAVREGRPDDATRFFALPAVIYQPSTGALEVRTKAIAKRFNSTFPCGARLIGTRADGRYVVGTFRLVQLPAGTCTTPGALVRVGFVFGDRHRPRRFTEWWRVPDTAGAETGPARRPAVPIAGAGAFG